MPNLLNLPAEIRNQIYSYALPTDKSYEITPAHYTPALCQSNRQMRTEALPIWRSSNAFCIYQNHNDDQAIERMLRLESGLEHIAEFKYTHLSWKSIGYELPGGHFAYAVKTRIHVTRVQYRISYHKAGMLGNYHQSGPDSLGPIINLSRVESKARGIPERIEAMINLLKELLERELVEDLSKET